MGQKMSRMKGRFRMKLDFNNIDKLLEQLDNLFPKITFGQHDSLDKIRYLSGQRSVVDFLLSQYHRNEES
jgi:hypothetical protein